MKKITYSLIIALCSTSLFGQFISDNGKFVCAIANHSLIVKSTTNNWEKVIPGGRTISTENPFSDALNYIEYLDKTRDSMFILSLANGEAKTFLTGIKKIIKRNQWICYQLKSIPQELVLRDRETGDSRKYSNVIDFSFSDNGNSLLLKTNSGEDNSADKSLMLVDLNTGLSKLIWTGDVSRIKKYSFDTSGTKIAFIVKNNVDSLFSIWYCTSDMPIAAKVNTDVFYQHNSDLFIGNDRLEFTPNGQKIIFNFISNIKTNPNPEFPKLDIWSYADAVLQSQQLIRAQNWEWKYAAVFSIPDKKIVRLQYDNEYLLGTPDGLETPDIQITNDYALICQFEDPIPYPGIGEYAMDEYNWNKAEESNVYLVSCNDGSRTLLKSHFKPVGTQFPFYKFSPDGRYIVFFDPTEGVFKGYEISTKTVRNICHGFEHYFVTGSVNGEIRDAMNPARIQSWISNNSNFLIRDKYGDIWRLDPTGKNKPFSITKELARKNNILFDLADETKKELDVTDKSTLILHALNNRNLNTGYYSVSINGSNDPKEITGMGPYVYTSFTKAILSNVFFFRRQSAVEPDACYYTKDFKNVFKLMEFRPFTNIGINKQLVFWKTFDGTEETGLLFKPIDFDSTKKYPIIFQYYENDLVWLFAHSFEPYSVNKVNSDTPPLGVYSALLDYPYWLNHEYLIFIPDIHYRLGGPGKSVYNSVVSAAEYFRKKPFVDGNKMGLIGHSFGGYETNYLLTHTNIFAAACSGSGVSDLVSNYGVEEIAPHGFLKSASTEIGQNRVGTSLWQRPDLFIKNSPIFYADRVTTPVLMMANKKDWAVPFAQGVEFFKAMRRLGKRCWLLQYDQGGHMADEPQDMKDWGIRMAQFFDHYLKGAPAPVWMTRGIPATQKGLTLGYEYDSTMKTPGPGLFIDNKDALTPEQKVLLSHKTTVNNEGRIVDVIDNKPKLKGKKVN